MTTLNTTPKLAYSIPEVCKSTSLGRTTVFNHIKSGRLRATRIGGRTVIPAAELQRFIAGDSK